MKSKAHLSFLYFYRLYVQNYCMITSSNMRMRFISKIFKHLAFKFSKGRFHFSEG
jgi:hypothetical protein